jgi:wyosine [tRNA(Phe)-imidazoG37] synthetase (radical SAM superfamily)
MSQRESKTLDDRASSAELFANHARGFEANRFVYPVLSRRSGGISIGVNLNPDKVCNFDCIYCQVDRVSQSEVRFVEMPALLAELETMLQMVATGALYQHPRFRDTPEHLRRLNDIAFSGDGEPTTYRNFDEIVEKCAALKARIVGNEVKLVLITNASMFHREVVKRGLEILDRNNGEIWAKLDAGTDEYYQLVERTTVPFQKVLDNITSAAQVRPVVIQALFMRIQGESPSAAEQEAFCDRLNEITAAGGRIKLVQVYTVARRPAESFVTALSNAEVDSLVEQVRRRTGLAAAAYYGHDVSAD